MADVFGVTNLKKLIKFGFGVSKQISVALEDKKFTWPEALGFLDEIMEIPGVVKSFADIKKELGELSEAERLELHTYAVAEFDIPNDKVELFVEDALMWSISTVSLVTRFLNLNKPLNPPV